MLLFVILFQNTWLHLTCKWPGFRPQTRLELCQTLANVNQDYIDHTDYIYIDHTDNIYKFEIQF